MKIGIFDSGVGGLTVLKECYRNFPNLDYIYIGDNKNSPYGDKTKEQLFSYATKIIDYFILNNVDIVIIACNTICSNIFEQLKKKYANITIMGVIDTTVELFLNSGNKNVLVMATEGTINSCVYEKKINDANKKIKVHSLATKELVPLIENNKDVSEVLNKYLEPYNDIDSIILGCTHYKLIEEKIEKVVSIINSSDGIVDELKNYIKESKSGSIQIYTTGKIDKFNIICRSIMNVCAKKIKL